MRHIIWRRLLYVIIFIIPLAYCIGLSHAGLIDTLPNTLWENKFGDAEYSYHNKAAFLSPKDSGLFIAGEYTSSARGVPTVTEGLWVWKVNPAGEKIIDLKLKNPADDAKKYSNVEALAITENEDIILIAQMRRGRANLLKLNSAGEILLSKELKSERDISRIIPTADNNFLLIGHDKFNSLLMKIDANGEVLWEKINDRGKDDMFVNGILTEDGGFILIENSGKSAQFYLASSEMWITKYDSKGEKITEKSFPGRHGSIARGKDGSYAIVYDKSGTAKQDIWAKAVDKDLNEKWDVNVTSTDFGLESFKIASLTNGDYIVAGPIMLRPWVSYIDSTGVKKWDFYNKAMEPASGTDFISKGNDCFIVSSVVAITDQYKINNKIKAIKFQP